jgi:hypothetical protein
MFWRVAGWPGWVYDPVAVNCVVRPVPPKAMVVGVTVMEVSEGSPLVQPAIVMARPVSNNAFKHARLNIKDLLGLRPAQGPPSHGEAMYSFPQPIVYPCVAKQTNLKNSLFPRGIKTVNEGCVSAKLV